MACGLAACLVAYLVVLGVSLLSGKTAPVTSPSDMDVQAAPDPTIRDDQEEAASLERQIRNWHQASFAIEETYRFLKAGNVAAAERRLARSIEQNPDMVDVQVAAGRVALEKGDIGTAKQHLLQALQREPTHAAARNMLARILEMEEHHESALVAAQWILKTDPYSTEAHRAAASAYLSLDRPRMALPHLRRVSDLSATDELDENKLVDVYRRLGQYDQAIALLERRLRQNNANSITYYNMAVCYADMGDTDAFVGVLEQAAEAFGKKYVRTWLTSEELGDMRNDPAVIQFAGQEEVADEPASDEEAEEAPAPPAEPIPPAGDSTE